MTTNKKVSDYINYDPKGLAKKTQVDLYYKMVRPRLIEEKMLSLLRQGKISKWFSGIGRRLYL